MQPKDDSASRIEDIEPRGRHNPYPRELADTICKRIAEGESLRAVCRDEGMPAASTFLLWLKDDPALTEQYAKAMEMRADAIFDEVFDIADNGANDWIEANDPENPGYRLNGEHIQRSRLRVDTRKWALARMNAKKYGDKVSAEVTGKDGERLIPETSDSDAARAILFALAKVRDQAGG